MAYGPNRVFLSLRKRGPFMRFWRQIGSGGSLIVLGLALNVASSGARAAEPTTRPAPLNWTAQQDHQNMMDQLGIKALRPGPSGNEQAPNHANYDEATANPYPDLP